MQYSLQALRRATLDLMQSTSNHGFLRDFLLLALFVLEAPFITRADRATLAKRSVKVSLSFNFRTSSFFRNYSAQACWHLVIYSGSSWESRNTVPELSWFHKYFGGGYADLTVATRASKRCVHCKRHDAKHD